MGLASVLGGADRVGAAAGQQDKLAATGQPLDLPAAAQLVLHNASDLSVLGSRRWQDNHPELMGCIDGHRHLFLEAERASSTRQ